MDDDIATALKDLRAEVATHGLETRANVATLRADLAEHRLTVTQGFSDVNRKLDLLIDALAEFRAEYNEHTHGGQ